MSSRYFAAFVTIPFLLSMQLSVIAQDAIPDSIKPCIQQLNTKRSPVGRVSIFGHYKESGKTYYSVWAYPPQSERGWDAVVSATQSGCRVEAANPMGDPAPATVFLPPSAARGLTLNVLKKTIQRVGGPQKYQAFLLQIAQQSGHQLTLMPYEVWAINKLGIQIPPSIKIVTPK